MTELMRALRYPWRGEGWFWRMLPLAFWQLVPLIGQTILIGYGLSVVRATCRQQTNLPKLQLKQSLIDGLRLVAVGFLYCFPIILMVLLTFSTSNEAKITGSVPPIAFTAVMFLYLRMSGEIIKRRPALKSTFSTVNKIVTAIFITFVAIRLYSLFTALRSGLQLSAVKIDSSSMVMLGLASLISAVIVVALLVSGTLFAATGSSLFKPATTIQWMAENRTQSIRLLITVWLLGLGTFIATLVGAVFLLIPGLFLLVAGSASIWFLAARYAINTGAVNIEGMAHTKDGIIAW
ncbi:MAG: DUF4013 domain-containing protein [Cyanobacteria bacterium J06598_1]